MSNLNKEKMYVLGPLELSPGHFAVGEKSYLAIRGNMPYYNGMRNEFYLSGNKEAGDAIGELETRAITAEAAYEKMTVAKKSADKKFENLYDEIEDFKKKYPSAAKELAAFRLEREKKKNKESNK